MRQQLVGATSHTIQRKGPFVAQPDASTAQTLTARLRGASVQTPSSHPGMSRSGPPRA